jgi:hypothetical protein
MLYFRTGKFQKIDDGNTSRSWSTRVNQAEALSGVGTPKLTNDLMGFIEKSRSESAIL